MLYFFPSLSLFAFYSRFLSFVQNNLNTISTHVHINKQQGSIHLHQSLNWHILRSYFFVCTKFLLKVSNSMCFISKNVLILVPFLFYIFFYFIFPVLVFVLFHFFSVVNILSCLALEEMSTFYLFNTLINIHNERALGRTGVLFSIHPKSKEAEDKIARINIIQRHSLCFSFGSKSRILMKKCKWLRKYFIMQMIENISHE